jgi:hypothetical protein
MFDLLRTFISYAALELLYKQRLLAREEARLEPSKRSVCTGTFTRSIGLPCKHTIIERKATNQTLRLTDIDSSWVLRDFGAEYRRPILPPYSK